MPAEKAIALVVRGSDWSETSRIATLWTREFGKVRALAKGGRRLNSNFEIALDLLTVCHIVFLRKASGLDLLTEAQVAERFPRLRSDLPSLYAGYYVAELLADGTQDLDPHPALFDSAIATLRALESAAETVLDCVTAFELAWLRELGYSPRLDACAGCGVEMADAPRVGFSPAAGGVLCPNCTRSAVDHRPLSRPAWEALRVGRAGSAPGVRREVRAALGHAVGTVLGRRPKLLGYVDGR